MVQWAVDLDGEDDEVLCEAFDFQITRKDIRSLDGLTWLNDQVSVCVAANKA